MNDAQIDRLVSAIEWSFGNRRRRLDAELKRLSEEEPAVIRDVIEAVIRRLGMYRFWRTAWCVAGFGVGFLLAGVTEVESLAAIIIPWELISYNAPRWPAIRARSILSKTGDVQVIRLLLWLAYSADKPGSSEGLRVQMTELLPRLGPEHADLIEPEHRERLRQVLLKPPGGWRNPSHDYVIAVLKGLVQIGDRESYRTLRYLAANTDEPVILHLAKVGIRELEASESVPNSPVPRRSGGAPGG